MTMLPYSLGSSLASMPSELSSSLRHLLNVDAIGLSSCLAHRVLSTAQSRHRQPKVHHLRRPRPVVDRLRYGRSIVSAAISPGTDDPPGLMMLLSDTSPRSTQIAFPLIAGVGLGLLFHAPYQVFTRALRRQEVAAGTSAFFLVRFTGATVGLVSFLCFSSRNVCRRRSLTPRLRQAVAGAVFRDQLSETLPAGVSASSVLESLDVLQSRDDWPAILRALTLAIKVRVPAFRGIPPD